MSLSPLLLLLPVGGRRGNEEAVQGGGVGGGMDGWLGGRRHASWDGRLRSYLLVGGMQRQPGYRRHLIVPNTPGPACRQSRDEVPRGWPWHREQGSRAANKRTNHTFPERSDVRSVILPSYANVRPAFVFLGTKSLQ